MRLLLSATMLLGLAACVSSTTVAPYPAVPAPMAETPPPPPVSATEQVWQPGAWDWNGTGYSWRPGAWVQRSVVPGGTLWRPGFWSRDSGTWRWVPAGWV